MRVRPVSIGRLLLNRVGIQYGQVETLIRLEGLDVPLNENYKNSDF